MPGVIVFLILIGATIAIGLAVVTHRTTIAQWTKAADALGIEINPGSIFSPPRLNGLVSDQVVSVHTFQSSSGNNQQRYTRFEVTYTSIGLELELSRQTKVGGFFRRMVGMQDVEIGDPAFDDAFVVKIDTTLTGNASLLFATFIGASSTENASTAPVGASLTGVIAIVTSCTFETAPVASRIL